jgi:hypothetical protein
MERMNETAEYQDDPEETDARPLDKYWSVKQAIASNEKLRNQLKTLKIPISKLAKKPFMMLYSTLDTKQTQ